MSENKRSVTIEIFSKDTKKKKVSISILSNTLISIQQTVYQLGKSKVERDPSLRGPYPSFIKRELELFIDNAKTGSICATLTFPEKEATLFPDFPDFAEQIIQDFHKIIKGIKNQNKEVIHKSIPNPKYRKRIIETITPILPTKTSEYNIAFQFGNNPRIERIERPNNEQLINLIGKYEEEIREEVEEAVINARCLARIKPDGQIEKILDIINYELFEELDLRPYRTNKIEWLNRIFLLSKEIACNIKKEDSLIILEYEPLNITVYNFSRDEVVEDFAEEFAFLWDNYAIENDSNLTEDAIILKNKMKELVKKIEKK